MLATPATPGSDSESGNPRDGWRIYQTVRFLLRWLKWWVRVEASGLENLPQQGPALVVSNHDAWLDPLAIIETMMWRKRQLRFLAKSSLWKSRVLAWILDEAAQIPIRRGQNDLPAMDAAVSALGRGETIGIFPEGTLSRGEHLRARRGVSRLAQACPEVPIVLVAVSGSPVLKRFPKRPKVHVEYFSPEGGQARPEEDQGELAQRWLDEIRRKVPPAH
ncbi:MAG: lysophospholipid acyltransferase family protein [Solirubrobacterales bacterium]